jgi:restriction system protein
MAIPDYQSLMLPLLLLASDQEEHTIAATVGSLAKEFKLSEQEQEELLPSGSETVFANRVRWARTYLKKAALIDATGRGRFRISQRGEEVLKDKPRVIDDRLLAQFAEFQDFKPSAQSGIATAEPTKVGPTKVAEAGTPQELLDASYQELRQSLAQEVLDHLKTCSPRFFERVVVNLLVAMGYGGSRRDAGQAVGQTGDGGIDGIIKEDKLGLDAIYLQAKRWEGTVGRPVVQGFSGSLDGAKARKGVLITTSQFSQDARDYVRHIEKKIVLIDGKELAQLMIDYGLGVAEVASYAVKRLDADYFDESE